MCTLHTVNEHIGALHLEWANRHYFSTQSAIFKATWRLSIERRIVLEWISQHTTCRSLSPTRLPMRKYHSLDQPYSTLHSSSSMRLRCNAYGNIGFPLIGWASLLLIAADRGLTKLRPQAMGLHHNKDTQPWAALVLLSNVKSEMCSCPVNDALTITNPTR